MHFLLSRSGAHADADRYQRQLNSILAVARRRELESPAPDRRPLPDDCPSTGEGFAWQVRVALDLLLLLGGRQTDNCHTSPPPNPILGHRHLVHRQHVGTWSTPTPGRAADTQTLENAGQQLNAAADRPSGVGSPAAQRLNADPIFGWVFVLDAQKKSVSFAPMSGDVRKLASGR